MNYGEIKTCDIANGKGVRVSLFVSGCTHHCKGCFNPETWDFNYGDFFGNKERELILAELDKPYVSGLSLLGGEPFEPANQWILADFIEKVKKLHPDKNIWCYTGYLLDRDLVEGGAAWCDKTEKMLANIDVLVDGPFEEKLKDISLAFRGSSNQRIIDVPESLKEGRVVVMNLDRR